MQRFSVSYAKAHLSELLRRVRAGREVLVTDRGVPVARLVPVRLDELSEAARKLVLRGLAMPPAEVSSARLVRELPRPPKAPPGVSLLDALLREREEGR
jgi:prevent-host-death family protein